MHRSSAVVLEDTVFSEVLGAGAIAQCISQEKRTADFTVALESPIDAREEEEMRLDSTRQERAVYVSAAAVMALPVFLL